MSLSLHSSVEAFTSSKRGSEKDRDIEPEKSSIGESSARMSSRPPEIALSPRAAARSRQLCAPINHSNESVCRSRSPGTSRGSRLFANETLFGAPGIPETALVWLETATLRPSSPSRGPLVLLRPPLYLLRISLCTTRTKLVTVGEEWITPQRYGREVDRRQPAQRPKVHPNSVDVESGTRNSTQPG